jgi:anaerobic magnesium-protoporphyrin IX monomethyl ester cyclase
MSKILLIKPRFLGLEFQVITQPMGLAYIGATLKKTGHEPRIHDCALDYKDLHILRHMIGDWKPDFIGISVIITELEQTNKIMEIIREILPDVPVTVGGPWPSANPIDAIKTLGADFVVIGEGELVFPELINAINNGHSTEEISGTASMINGNIKINPGRYLTEDELNNLPFPAWELLDHTLYKNNPSGAIVGCRNYMTVITSRGCPYQCSYCHNTMGKVFRKRSAESVISEIEELRFKYGFKEFEIFDDCFNFDRERMRSILRNIKIRIRDARLHFPNALRSDILEPEDMALFKQAGTVSASFSIETSSRRIQKLIHKNLNIEKAMRVINASVKEGIYSSGFFMLGFPTETYEEAVGTVKYALNSSFHRVMFMLVTPFAGTELAEMIPKVNSNKSNTINPLYINFFNNSFNISAMSDDELHRVFRSAYIRFYMNPRKVLRLIINHPRILSLPRYAFTTMMKMLPRRHSS